MHVEPETDGTRRPAHRTRCASCSTQDDLLVVNDAATLPASLLGANESGFALEARLAGEREDGTWRAVLFGPGDWHARTEERALPPRVRVGECLHFDHLDARVAEIEADSPRLVALDFEQQGADLWRALYRAGRPVQYSYAARPFELWDVQTAYSSRPWAVEAPSAGFALTWNLLLDLRRRGVGLARVTHAAGLSSTGEEALDARLPFVERYEIPEDTAHAVASAKERGGRVVAVGTTATRALESSARRNGGAVAPERATTDLRLGAASERFVVDGLLTGVHDAADEPLRTAPGLRTARVARTRPSTGRGRGLSQPRIRRRRARPAGAHSRRFAAHQLSPRRGTKELSLPRRSPRRLRSGTSVSIARAAPISKCATPLDPPRSRSASANSDGTNKRSAPVRAATLREACP
jgi:S-adenosylmethionine:tRNA ribosyltransferase-isomerase